MNRRQFLQGIGATTLAAAIPASYAIPETGGWKTFTVDPEHFCITINANGMSMGQLYDYCKIILRADDGFPLAEFDCPEITFHETPITV